MKGSRQVVAPRGREKRGTGGAKPAARRAAERRDSRSSATLRAAAAVVLAGLVVWAYATSFDGVFVFDDRPGIQENLSIRSWATAFHPPSTSPLSSRPVTNLTFAVNYALGDSLAGYHAVNLLIHLGSVFLAFGVIRRTLLSTALAGRFGDRATPIAFAGALLWGVHPLTTGAVVYLVQRVESLMGFFYLLTLYCAIRAGTQGSSRLWAVAAVAASALGMASKEVMLTSPVMVWLWHVVFERALWAPWADRARRWLYLALCATWLVLAILIGPGTQAVTALKGASDAAAAGATWTPWTYLLTQAGVIVHYLRLAVVPAPLVLDYYGWPPAATPLDVLPQLLLVGGLIAATVVALSRRNALGFAGAWSFGILAPTSSLLPIPTEIAAEHRMYLPLVAVAAVVAAGAYVAAAALTRPTARRGTAVAVVTAAVALSLVLGSVTRARARLYASEGGLWQDTVSKRPDNARARVNYGISLISESRLAEAEDQMRRALPLRADVETRAQINLQLGAALCAQGRCADGIAFVEEALRLDPDLDDADPVLGQVYSEVGNLAKSLFYLRRAADRTPQNVAVLTRLAWLLATAAPEHRDGAAALAYAERAAALTARQDPAVLEALAAALAGQRRLPEAAQTLHEAAAAAERRGEPAAAASLRRQADVYRRAAEAGRVP